LSTVLRTAAIVLGFAAVLPLRAGDLRPRAQPAHDYADALTRARDIVAGDDSVVAEGGASILRTHGRRTPRAIVLLHGFTNSPRQFAELADSLSALGDNVFVPRLPRHALRGETVGSLSRLTAAELCRAVDSGIDVASGLGDSVIVVGLSLGGTLALWAAQNRPEVRRAVAIAPPFEVTKVPAILERPIVNLGSRVPNLSRSAAADSARPDRLPGFTTHALAQVLYLGMTVRRGADQATPLSPELVLVVNARDRTVKRAPILDVAKVWNRRGAPVTVFEVPDSLELPHNIMDPVLPHPSTRTLFPALVAWARGDAPPAGIAMRH
jgi:carboxylesterase